MHTPHCAALCIQRRISHGIATACVHADACTPNGSMSKSNNSHVYACRGLSHRSAPAGASSQARAVCGAASSVPHSHARAEEDAILPPNSFIACRDVQPTKQPFGQVGSASGGGATSPYDHWHSWVSKFGTTRRDNPSSSKSCCACEGGESAMDHSTVRRRRSVGPA